LEEKYDALLKGYQSVTVENQDLRRRLKNMNERLMKLKDKMSTCANNLGSQ